jgi:hypothetical protein
MRRTLIGTTETGPSATMTESDDRSAAVGVAAGWSGFARLGLLGPETRVQGSSMSGFAAR